MGWNARSAWLLGLVLFALDLSQTLLLLPFLLAWLGAADVGLWLALTSAAGLVNVAYSTFSPPQVRHIAQREGPASDFGVRPADWAALQRQGHRVGGGLLALLLLAYALSILVPQLRTPGDAAAVGLYALSLVIRLRAFTGFVLLNGLLQIGRDKWLLVGASALTLVLTIAAAWWLRSLAAMAAASLIASLWLWWACSRAARGELQRRAAAAAPPVAVAGRTEMRRLFALNLAGFVNLGTCVPLATLWLPAEQGVAFGFWFRAAAVAGMAAGMHAQIRFAPWSRAGWDKAATGRELRVVNAASWAFVALLFLAAMALPAGAIGPAWVQLSPWTVLALCSYAALSAGCQVLGQLLMARGDTGFTPKAIACAFLAPVLACLLAWALVPQALIGGYLIATIGLCAVLVRHWARLADQAPATRQ